MTPSGGSMEEEKKAWKMHTPVRTSTLLQPQPQAQPAISAPSPVLPERWGDED